MKTLLGLKNMVDNQLTLPSDSPWTREQFAELCQANPDLNCELDPEGNVLIIYTQDQGPTTLERPDQCAADPVLPGFVLDLAPIW